VLRALASLMEKEMGNLKIFETDFWDVTYRRDARYPGNLMVWVKSESSNLSELAKEALFEMGKVLSLVEELLNTCYKPHKVIFAKLGFTSGHGAHFHAIPVSVALLSEIELHPSYTNHPDGNDALLFVSREYAERPLSEKEVQLQSTEVARLREAYSNLASSTS